MTTWPTLNRSITRCTLCPRLRTHCTTIAKTKRAAFKDQDYWGKPIPNLAPPDPATARLLIVGLAPAAHGGNRTGRVFTGDRSGDFLFAAMHQTGFANQSTSTHIGDGLELIDCAITAMCHCAPPDNKPTPQEIGSCEPFLDETFKLLPNLRGVMALGKLAFDASARLLKRQGFPAPTDKRPAFAHGAIFHFGGIFLLATYHPSQQNTFTGRLTPQMLRDVFTTARAQIAG